jgi:hypothetical protein
VVPPTVPVVVGVGVDLALLLPHAARDKQMTPAATPMDRSR